VARGDHKHAAADITSGTIDNARLDTDLQDLADGSLSGSKVGYGISASNISSGTLSGSRVNPDFWSTSGIKNITTNYGITLGHWNRPKTDDQLLIFATTNTDHVFGCIGRWKHDNSYSAIWNFANYDRDQRFNSEAVFYGNLNVYGKTDEGGGGRIGAGQYSSDMVYLTHNGTNARLYTDVGQIRIEPQSSCYIAGTLETSNGTCSCSDKRFKKKVKPLKNCISKIENLQPVTFNWKTRKHPERNFPEGKQLGLIAQETEKIIPELVHTDSEGHKGISYDKLTVVLLKAMKEQQKIIENQEKKISSLANRIEKLERSKGYSMNSQ
ncbi:MAG: hypothetical protein GF350_07250, partial [Chitinivibrionales bacterium]|nr:hypothetical protein [Chitinivibrionales bacterium]